MDTIKSIHALNPTDRAEAPAYNQRYEIWKTQQYKVSASTNESIPNAVDHAPELFQPLKIRNL